MGQQYQYKQAIWFYGIIVALSIQSAVNSVIPNIFKALSETSGTVNATDVWRFIVFLILIVRFYLGAVNYFPAVYDASQSSERKGAAGTGSLTYKKKSFGIDFIVGLFHFFLFAGLSLAIPSELTISFGKHVVSTFSFLVALILIYDLLWWLLNCRNDTSARIRPWALINAVNFLILALPIVFGIYFLSNSGHEASKYDLWENVFLASVLLISIFDVAGLTSGENLVWRVAKRFGVWIISVFTHDKSETEASSDHPADLDANDP